MDRDQVDATVQRMRDAMGEAFTPELESKLRSELTSNYKSITRATSEMDTTVGVIKGDFEQKFAALEGKISDLTNQPPPATPPKGKGQEPPAQPAITPLDIAAVVKDLIKETIQPLTEQMETIKVSVDERHRKEVLGSQVKDAFKGFGSNAEMAFRQALAASDGEVFFRQGESKPSLVPSGQGEYGTLLRMGDRIITDLPELAKWFSEQPSGRALTPIPNTPNGSGHQPTPPKTPEGGEGENFRVPATESLKNLLGGKTLGKVGLMEAYGLEGAPKQ